METTIYTQKQVEDKTQDYAHVDITHTNRLSTRERAIVDVEAAAFITHIKARYVNDAYLHLDVIRTKETKAGVNGIAFKALLVTNKGRFFAEQQGFGVFNSLHSAFEALETQLTKLR
ncbi:MAG: hypothetical protein ACMXYD_05770 [Candidatus Woesearchaeota archaeon]